MTVTMGDSGLCFVVDDGDDNDDDDDDDDDNEVDDEVNVDEVDGDDYDDDEDDDDDCQLVECQDIQGKALLVAQPMYKDEELLKRHHHVDLHEVADCILNVNDCLGGKGE